MSLVLSAGSLLGLLLALAGLLAPPGGDGPASGAPKDWLAFVAESGGFAPAVFRVQQSTPSFIVFQDGRAVWRDARRSRTGTGLDPEGWREGRVDSKALAAFAASAKTSPFLTNRAAPGRGMGGIADAMTTTVGVSAGGAARVLSIYALEIRAGQGDGDAALRSAASMKDAILALKPKESRVYEGAIRVGLFPGGEGAAVEWPVAQKPTPGSGFSTYSGADAKRVIAALARSALVRVNGQVYRADWAPAIDVPRDTPS